MSNKEQTELLRHVSPMRSTTVESNDLHSFMFSVSKDAKSSSKITFTFFQLDFQRFRVSHIIEWSIIPDSMSKKEQNELLRDVSPIRSTAAESNDLQPFMLNSSNDEKSSSKITFAFSQFDSERSRASHIMKWSKFNVKQRTKMNYSETSVQCARQL